MINQQVGRYTITRKIGRGGMATVYQAYDNRFQRDVAIKMLHPADMDDDTTQKFEQEARIIASLEHHAIVPVYDFGEHEGQPYLVMRLMDGGSLKERLAYGALPLDEAAEILRRICSALDKAHANHIVHRDIKPGNILFDEEGIAFLADFGIARLTDRTQTTTVVGSPRYMAPEQAQGLPLNAQTDVYQMGVVLFHMLTGRPPFNGETTESILYQHVHADVPLLIDLDGTIPPRCDSVIGYALAKNPAERFTSAGELSRAFDRAIGQVPIASPPARPAAPSSQPTYSGSNEATATYTMTQASAAQPPVVTAQVRPPHPTTSAEPQKAPYQPPRRRPWGWILGLGITAFVLLACGITILSIFWPLESEGGTVGVAVPTPIGGEAPAVVTSASGEENEPNLAPTVTLPSAETIEAGEQVIALTPDELSELGGGTGVLIYAAQREGNFDIYKLLPDGSEEQLTDYDDDDFRPVWSPDGNR
ncbi:MAG: protein kinase, partial [Anaerolineales bacterium]|nr:protein kinase [Anaerolineales bacterium]